MLTTRIYIYFNNISMVGIDRFEIESYKLVNLLTTLIN